MRQQIILSAIFLFVCTALFAQKNEQDVLYLKNGTVIRGFISEFQPDKSVTIKTAEQSVFVFQMYEVDKITREVPPDVKQFKIKKKGYFNESAMLFQVGGIKGDFNTAFSFTTVSGYQINRFFRIGGGVGVTHYADYSHTFFPVFARVSGDIIKFRITPIYFADAGYSFQVEKDDYSNNSEELSSTGGLMLHTGVGLKFYTTQKASFSLTAGITLQKSKREYQYEWSEGPSFKEERTYRRIAFGFGMNF